MSSPVIRPLTRKTTTSFSIRSRSIRQGISASQQTERHLQTIETEGETGGVVTVGAANLANLAKLAILARAAAKPELAFANLQGFDLVLERRRGNVEPGRRA